MLCHMMLCHVILRCVYGYMYLSADVSAHVYAVITSCHVVPCFPSGAHERRRGRHPEGRPPALQGVRGGRRRGEQRHRRRAGATSRILYRAADPRTKIIGFSEDLIQAES